MLKTKVLLERVQHRFTRMFSDLKKLPYKERLNRLGLWSLEERRNRADLVELFKMVKGFSALSWTQFFSRTTITNSTRGHNWKLTKSHHQSEISHHFFSQRSIIRWNSLSQEVVDASINSFKNHLEKLRKRQMDFFLD